jgi:hypothetical protein
MTGAIDRIDITGRCGVALRDVWAAGPRTYLGLGVAHLDGHGHRSIEATEDAQDRWIDHVNGKPRVFMPLPGFPAYVETCTTVAENGYEGFVLS